MVLGLIELGGDSGGGRRPLQRLGQPVSRRQHLELYLLDAPRGANGPATVAEVPFELSSDGRDREGEEVAAFLGTEALGGGNQRRVRDLLEVLAGNPLAPMGGGQRPGHPQVRENHVLESLTTDVRVLVVDAVESGVCQ